MFCTWRLSLHLNEVSHPERVILEEDVCAISRHIRTRSSGDTLSSALDQYLFCSSCSSPTALLDVPEVRLLVGRVALDTQRPASTTTTFKIGFRSCSNNVSMCVAVGFLSPW